MKEIDFQQFCYTSWAPNETLLLQKDTAIIEIDNKQYPAEAEVSIRLLPRPGLEIKTKLPDITATHDLFNNDNLRFYLGENFVEIPGFFINSEEDAFTWVPNEEPIIFLGNKSTSMNTLIFHLFNFKEFLGMRRSMKTIENKSNMIDHIDLVWQDWTIEIQSLFSTHGTFETLKKQGGYGLTHVGCISQKKRDSFLGQDAENVLEALRYFFSFVKGIWCPPVICLGFSDDGSKVWEMWNSPNEPWYSSILSWCDPHHSDHLFDLFPGFMEMWQDKFWQTAFREVIYWYLNSNFSSRGIDAGIILTQAAIERLSFEYSERSKKLKTIEGFKNLWASKKFRLLFSSLDIPNEVPSNLSTLQELSRQFKWSDAPHAFTEVRNSLVHPEHKKRGKTDKGMFEAWNLGLWYLEMSILRLCGHEGTYSNRLHLGKWIGQVEEVPWKKS